MAIYLIRCDECVKSELREGPPTFTHLDTVYAARGTLNELLARMKTEQERYNKKFYPHTKVDIQVLSITELPDDTDLELLAEFQVQVFNGD